MPGKSKKLSNMNETEISALTETLNLDLKTEEFEENLKEALSIIKSFTKLQTFINEKIYLRNLIQLGNSLALTIPLKIVEKHNLKAGRTIILYEDKGVSFLYYGKNNNTKITETIDTNDDEIQFNPHKPLTDLQKIEKYLMKVEKAHYTLIVQETGVKKETVCTYLSQRKELFEKVSDQRGVWKLKIEQNEEENH